MKEQPPKKFNKINSKFLWIILTIFSIFVVMLLPTNYYVETEGGAYQVSKYFEIDQPKTKSGGFYFTAVSIRPATVFAYLTNSMRDFSELVKKEDIDGSNSSTEHQQVEQIYMENSINSAIYYAAKQANDPVKQTFSGIYVMEVMAHSSFKNKLHVGDIITQVDGQNFSSANDLIAYFNKVKLNQLISIKIERNGKIITLRGKAIKLPEIKRVGIGITLTEKTKIISTPKVNANVDDVGGPSAGLMFTLELYQQLSGRELSHSSKIAGTGTIDESGHVGTIGGIDKKVLAADKIGATVFFAPSEKLPGMTMTNYEEAKAAAKKLKTKMKIVPVENFKDAVTYLTQH